MIRFETVRYKNFLSSGNTFIEVPLNTSDAVLILGKNGSGKCVHKLTQIEIEFLDPETEALFKEMFKE